jgi:dienelactone hydrolase
MQRSQLTYVLAIALATSACAGATSDPSDSDALAQASDAITGGKLTLSRADTYTSTIPASGDPVDIYYPRRRGEVPVVVLLQGANVDKAQYATYAREVARQGFVVLVPNHAQTGPGLTGLFVTEEVVTQAFAFAIAESQHGASPLFGKVDPTSLGLLGHSFGGVVGLFAIAGSCSPPFCTPNQYTRPAALKAAAFWGTNLVQGGQLFPIDTSAAAVALLQGEADGKAHPADTAATYPELATPRAFITFEGANHYGITDDNNPAGAQPDPSAQTLPQDLSIAETALFSGLFLRAHVQGDWLAAAILDNIGSSVPGVVVQAED